MSYPTRPDARVVVGLDFGTTFSGFGYAHKTDTEEVCVHHEWPGFTEASGKPYCKTQTALYYKPSRNGLQCDSWGWQAQLNYTRDLDLVQRKKALPNTVGELITRFKLHLADKATGPLSAEPLPRGLTTKQVISDFLREIGKFIMAHLNLKYGSHLSMEELQWCVTVPSIWGDKAKQQMKSFMEGAGLVGGTKGSPYPVMVVLEPEAAAVYCLKKLKSFKLNLGDKFLVADIGGGTSDIVVQEKANSSGNLKVKEVTASSGGLCGGSFVDQSFFKFLSSKISCNLDNFLEEYPKVKIQLQTWWENAKSAFEGRDTDLVLTCQLSPKLAVAWEKHDTAYRHNGEYSEVEITHNDMVKIFSEVVNGNIELIKAQLKQTSNIKFIMVVGGFATSKYLMSKIKQAFEPRINVISPNEPGRAICDGAVTIGFFPDNLISRIARRTYGIECTSDFKHGDPEIHAEYIDGVKMCNNKFSAFVKVGSKVDMDYSKEHYFWPVTKNQIAIAIRVHSSQLPSPKFVTDDGVTFEGSFDVDISSSLHMARDDRKILVSMFFGHSSIEVKAQPSHLLGTATGAEMLPVKFDWA